jgi:hypothetical protein
VLFNLIEETDRVVTVARGSPLVLLIAYDCVRLSIALNINTINVHLIAEGNGTRTMLNLPR